MVSVYRPGSLSEALTIRSQEMVNVLAGGTDLMVRNRSWSGTLPAFKQGVLFIGHLEELKNISVAKEHITIGASCTLAQILSDSRIPEYVKLPLMQMASPAIRNVATIGGNICNASPAGDTLPMLYALEASVQLVSRQAARIVGIEDFILGPGSIQLREDEILGQIYIPVATFNTWYYKKAGSRKANAISKVSFFAVANGYNSRILDLRIALGAVAPTPVRSREGEERLTGLELATLPDILPEIMNCYEKLLSPIDDIRSSRSYRHRAALLILESFLVHELTGY